VIQSTSYFATRTRRYSTGSWDEDLLWLFGSEALTAPIARKERKDFEAEQGGCYTLRSEQGFAFARCGSFRHRPGQADQLHLDLWWRGQNVALDSGTYSYNAPEPWDSPFARTAYHNSVTVDGLDQMDRAGRFLWLPWLRGRVRYHKRSESGHLGYWEGEHDGYERLKFPTTHRRSILRLPNESWLVLDRLTSEGTHRYRLHWLFPDLPHGWIETEGLLTLQTSAGAYNGRVGTLTESAVLSLVRADENGPRGWRAPYYNQREPALSLCAEEQAKSLCFWSVLGPEKHEVLIDGTTLRINGEGWRVLLRLGSGYEQPQIRSVKASGEAKDELEIS
jgi:asparagine synthase (glutamine-hydrolysing)